MLRSRGRDRATIASRPRSGLRPGASHERPRAAQRAAGDEAVSLDATAALMPDARWRNAGDCSLEKQIPPRGRHRLGSNEVWRHHSIPHRHSRQSLLNRERRLACSPLGRACPGGIMHALDTAAREIWRDLAAGQITEAEAQARSDAIETKRRQAAPRRHDVTMKSLRRHADRAQRDARMARRRRWAASGWLPPQMASRFTVGELAALSVIANECMRSGECRLAVGVIASVAGVCRTTAQNAVRLSRSLGLASSQERRQSARRNLPNVVRIVSLEWLAWLARRAMPTGFRNVNAAKASKEERGNCPIFRDRRLSQPGLSAERAASQTVPEMAEGGTVELTSPPRLNSTRSSQSRAHEAVRKPQAQERAVTDEERAREIATRVAGWAFPVMSKRLGQRATENAVAGLEEHIAPHISSALAAARAEALEEAARIADAQPYYPDTHTGMRQQWVKDEIARKVRALAKPRPARQP